MCCQWYYLMITLATYITLMRIVLIAPISYLLLNNFFLAAGFLAAIAAATDMLDGYIARKYHQESALGGLLDPLADKLFILTTITLLWCRYTNMVPVWFIVFLWAKETLMFAGALLIIVQGHTPPPARFSGKIAMAGQVSYCLLLFFTRYTELKIPIFLHGLVILVMGATLYALIDYGKVGYCTFYKS
ncbi:MAG: CDP-alcohol phosphatidyltransferase family protein [Candidatus Babeliaceae bacterium]|nr:CDP-alcohol phosphatidyltransferase family protein [Candidatus Babeliaceae bacterium]